MQDNVPHQTESPREPEEHIKPKETSLFSERSFPTALPETAAPASSVSPRSNTFQRVILPLGIFIGAIALIAWVSQYLPSWRAGEPTKKPPVAAVTAKPTLVFYQPMPLEEDKEDTGKLEFKRITSPQNQVWALWDVKYPEYWLEFEADEYGYYDYLFINESDQPAEIGLDYQSCNCSHIKVCVLPASQAKAHLKKGIRQGIWNRLPKDSQEADYGWKEIVVDNGLGVVVPPGEGGLVRLSWQGEKVKDKETLNIKVWLQPEKQHGERRVVRLNARIIPAPALHFYPETLEFGEIPRNEPAEREFWLWTGTRPSFNIAFPENATNPCIQCKAEPMTESECQKLTEKMLKLQQNTLVRTGYKVTVAVVEKKGDQQLDMGLLFRQVPLSADTKGGMAKVSAPYIHGVVASEVRIAGRKSFVLDLEEFSAKSGVKDQKFTLYTPKGVKLSVPKGKVAEPEVLRILDLKEKGVTGTGTQSIWELTLSIPGGGIVSGEMKNSYITLLSTSSGDEPRQIRIPVKGHGKGAGF